MLIPMSRPRLSEEAVHQIRSLIESGELSPGAKLPTERELTGQLRVSRGSVREALRTLEALGLVEVRPGRGTFVRPRGWEEREDEAIVSLGGLEEGGLDDVMEVRSIVETRACVLAAQRATAEDFVEMQSAIDQMREAMDANNLAGVVLGDMAFHHAVTMATKNQLLARLESAVAHHLMDGRRLSFSVQQTPYNAIDRHARIMAAIRSGDGEWAASMMLDAIKALQTRIRSAKTGADSAGVEPAADT